MFFYTDRKDAQFASIATFFIDKFPLAFKGSTTYTNERGFTSDQKLVTV